MCYVFCAMGVYIGCFVFGLNVGVLLLSGLGFCGVGLNAVTVVLIVLLLLDYLRVGVFLCCDLLCYVCLLW